MSADINENISSRFELKEDIGTIVEDTCNAVDSGEIMKINMLPSRTWNRLKVNESYVRMPKIKSFCKCEMNDAARSISCSAGGHRPEKYDDIESGMGSAVAGLGREADTAFAAKPGTDAAMGTGIANERDIEGGRQTDTVMISTEEGKWYDEPAVITYDYGEGDFFNRVIIDAAKGSRLSVIIVSENGKEMISRENISGEKNDDREHAGNSGSSHISTAVLRVLVNAGQGSDVRIYMVQMLGENSTGLTDIGIAEADDAKAEIVRAELGGNASYTGVLADLRGVRSYFEADTAYSADGGRKIDMNYTARHEGAKTRSLMNAAGVIGDDSEKVFRGTIDFCRGCTGAKGDEKEDVLLLGDHLVNKTVPLILCKEEDVEGNHGASIGELADDVLFYMGTRGISREQAEKLVAKAKLMAVISKIPSDEVRRKAAGFVG